jgi:hypothetical protein
VKKAIYQGLQAKKSWDEIGAGMRPSASTREGRRDEAVEADADAISAEVMAELYTYREARLARAAAPQTQDDRLTVDEQLEIRDQLKKLRELLKEGGP